MFPPGPSQHEGSPFAANGSSGRSGSAYAYSSPGWQDTARQLAPGSAAPTASPFASAATTPSPFQAALPAPYPSQQTSPTPQPLPVQPPSGLVPAKVKQRSRAVLAGALLTICAVVLLAWSSYQLLASIRIFAVLLGESGLLNGGALGGFALGALLALVGSVTALVGLVRSRPRLVPALLFIAAMVLPAVAAAEGTHQGAQALGAQTVASVDDYAARIEPQDVNKVYDALEAFGIKVPGREQVIEGLNKLKGTNNPAAPTPTTTP